MNTNIAASSPKAVRPTLALTRIRVAVANASLAVLAVSAAGCTVSTAEMLASEFTQSASATLLDVNGHAVGTVHFTEGAKAGVAVVAQFSGLAPGQHGIHLHTVGSCDPATTFSTAGSHFNPDGRKHGLETTDGPHAGDLPNVVVVGGGIGVLTTVTTRFTLSAGPASLLDADGSAVVLHAAVDDQHTDPSGNSGARIACGVVVRS